MFHLLFPIWLANATVKPDPKDLARRSELVFCGKIEKVGRSARPDGARLLTVKVTRPLQGTPPSSVEVAYPSLEKGTPEDQEWLFSDEKLRTLGERKFFVRRRTTEDPAYHLTDAWFGMDTCPPQR